MRAEATPTQATMTVRLPWHIPFLRLARRVHWPVGYVQAVRTEGYHHGPLYASTPRWVLPRTTAATAAPSTRRRDPFCLCAKTGAPRTSASAPSAPTTLSGAARRRQGSPNGPSPRSMLLFPRPQAAGRAQSVSPVRRRALFRYGDRIATWLLVNGVGDGDWERLSRQFTGDGRTGDAFRPHRHSAAGGQLFQGNVGLHAVAPGQRWDCRHHGD